MPEAEVTREGSAYRFVAYALVLVLTVQLALWGSFLVPFRLGSTPVPVSWLIAGVGNVALGCAGGRLAGHRGAAMTGLVWLLVVLVLSSRRAEGDLVVAGSAIGMVFLLLGALSSLGTYGVVRARSAGSRAGG